MGVILLSIYQTNIQELSLLSSYEHWLMFDYFDLDLIKLFEHHRVRIEQ